MRWLKRNEPDVVRPTEPINYPDGVAVQTEDETYYIKGGVRYRFPSDRVFESWSLKPIVGSEMSLTNFKRARSVMGFRDGTLVVDFSDNAIYFISNNKRRRVTNPDWLDNLNLDLSDAIVVSTKEISLHNEGEELP